MESSASILNCRRCGRDFALPRHWLFLPSCPHCGASARPLWRSFQDNRHAAVLAFFAIPVLTAGILLPFLSMTQMGITRSYSLLGGIGELFRHDHAFLGSILLIFSVVFPYAKLIALLTATSRLVNLRPITRRRLHHLSHLTGRYSLLDILVVAIIIIVIRFDGLLEATARSGTVFFTIAVFLSILAGMCAKLDEADNHG